jgi:hypothetical protein
MNLKFHNKIPSSNTPFHHFEKREAGEADGPGCKENFDGLLKY